MQASELLTTLHHQGFTLTPLPGGRLEVRPASKLPEELRQELKQRKAEVLTLLQQPAHWPCPHCGKPAVIEDVCPSLDGTRVLTLWHCGPCRTWGATPDTLRQPPVWVSNGVQ